MKNAKRVLALLLCLMMVITAVPMGAVVDSVKAFAAEVATDNTVDISAEKTKVDAFIKSLMDANDPGTIVSTWKSEFSWDNEKRETNGKDRLYDWSYYNGVVFEGLWYLYKVTGESKYKEYVVEYMEALIDEKGDWTTNSSSKTGTNSGYYANHGGDTIKTASLLMDLYNETGDSRYQIRAGKIYGDIDTAASKYSLPNAGSNLRHTWEDDPTYDLWLDGLYMVLPFYAEYAKYSGDTTELNLIVSRLQWVSDNMYNSSKKWFYHAANDSENSSKSYWLRSMGWYAAAIVDVMDFYDESSDNFTKLQAQLTKLLDGLYATASADNGNMWLNNLLASYNKTSNPYETSGSSLIYYAAMKAVNNGWISEDYADEAIACFEYICEKKLENNVLTDICFKGAPSQSSTANAEFANNEGKGVGPFIMFYAEMLEYVNKQAETPDDGDDATTPVTKEDETTKVTVTAPGITGITVEEVKATDKVETISSKVSSVLNTNTLAIYDIKVENFTADSEAIVTIPVPAGMDADNFAVYYVSDDGTIVDEMPGEKVDDSTYKFTTTHFSTYVGGTPLAEEKYNWIPFDGESKTIFSLVDKLTPGKKYVIVSSNQVGAATATNLTRSGWQNNYNYTVGSTAVEVKSSGDVIYIEVPDNSSQWTFSNNRFNSVAYNGRYLRGHDNALTTTSSTSSTYITWSYSNGLRVRSNSNSGNYRYMNSVTTSNGNSSTTNRVYIYEEDTLTTTGGFACLTGETVQTWQLTNDADTLNLNDVLAKVQVLTKTTANGTVTPITEGYTVTWVNDDTDGSVTGTITEKGNYTGTVTYQGKTLGTIKLSVVDKVIGNITFAPSSDTIERDDGEEEVTTLKITYQNNGGTEDVVLNAEDLVLVDENGKNIVNINKNGTYTGYIKYNGFTTTEKFTLNVVNKTGPEINDFPTYPNAGSVDVDKVAHGLDFQNTGLARVELSTSGIPVQVGVDVVLTIDISNSMAWRQGTNTDDWDDNKLKDVMTAINEFATIFLANNEDGTPTDNTITIVTFAGYDAENWNGSASYIDSVRTLVTGTNNINVINQITTDTKFTGKPSEYQIQLAYIPENLDQNIVSNVVTTAKTNNRGDTNYDFAFWQTNKAIEDGNLGNGNRDVYVLFMTDGCASNYNNTYYRTSTDAKNPDGSGMCSGETDYRGSTTSDGGKNWTDLILTSIANNKGNIYARSLYENIDGMYAVGFDMEYGSFSGIYDWDYDGIDWGERFNEIVRKSVTDDNGNGLIPVTPASDKETLKAFYSTLANELRYAATNAYFEDQMGDAFDLQMNPIVNSNASTAENGKEEKDTSIKVLTHPVYTAAQLGKTVTFTKDGETVTHKVEASDIGKAYGDAKEVEVVSFDTDDDGNIIATSTAVKEDDGNILNSGVICAKNFYYNTTKVEVKIGDITIPPETFRWNIGTINETQFTLSYVVYLTGSMDGKAPPSDSYYTNNYATLYYTNWVENEVFQSVPSPSMPWGGANVSYAFYLVNKDGTPLAANGTPTNIINAYKVTQPVLHKVMNLNSGETVKLDAIADDVLPEGYELFAPEAVYEVTVLSGDGASSWKITGDPKQTTYVTGYTNKLNEYLNTQDVKTPSYDYTHTTVYFAVKWVIGTVPDTVVIDFGLPVDIDVLANDMFGGKGTLVGVGAKAENMTFTTGNYSSNYGDAEVKNGKVRYTPKNMEMNTYDRFAYSVNYTGSTTSTTYYGDVTVIPATTIYYEDSFVDLSSYTWNYNENGWSEVTEEADAWTWSQVGTTVDATQAEDRPGYYSLSQIDANYIYGFDQAYENMSTYSMGSAIKAHVDYDNYAEATFNFYGTGFDVISLTSNKTGNMVVEVYNAAGTLEKSHVVDTYYGMDTDGSLITRDEDTIWQVPVMKVSGLTYGMHTAVIRVQYADIFDHGQYGAENSYDFYLDAIRIYDPAGTNYGEDAGSATGNAQIDDVIEKAYKEDKEAWPRYQEVRNNIIAAETFGEITVEGENDTTTKVDGVVFIDSANEVGKAQLADYVSYGPNNEVYLANGQAIAFEVEVPANVADVQIALKVANGNSVTYTINGKQYTTNSATDLYRSILAEAKTGTVVIENVSGENGGILSITNIKTTHTSEPVSASAFGVRMFMSRAAVNAVLAELNAEDEIIDDTTSTPEIDDTTSTPETSQPETSEPEVNEPEEDDTTSSKPDKEEKPGKGEKPDKENKPGKDEKPDKENKPGKEEKPDKEEKPEKNEKPEKPGKGNQAQNNASAKDTVKTIVKAVANAVAKLLGKLFN